MRRASRLTGPGANAKLARYRAESCNYRRNGMRTVTVAACVALLALGACGRSPGMRAATGGVGGAAVGTVLGGPVVGTAAGAVGGATVGAATAPDR
jgi:osmotically inducible lipoprotein OsmB